MGAIGQRASSAEVVEIVSCLGIGCGFVHDVVVLPLLSTLEGDARIVCSILEKRSVAWLLLENEPCCGGLP